MNLFLSWLPALVLMLFALVLRNVHKSWLAPGAFFSLMWSIFIAIPLLLAPTLYFSPLAVFWILLMVISLSLGSYIGGLVTNKPTIKPIELKLPSIKPLMLLFTLLGFINVVILLRASGQGFGVFLSFDALSVAANNYAVAKYHSDFSLPAIYSLINTFSYLGSFIGGMYWGAKRSKLSFLIFLPAILGFMVSTSKGGIIYMLVLFIGGLFATNLYSGNKKLFTFKFVGKTAILGGVLMFFFVLLSMFRYGTANMALIFERLSIYAFGYLSGFSEWFKSVGFNFNDLSYGQYTFAGIYDLIGIERAAGIYTDVVPINDDGGSTNIYTLYRMLIDDFGLFGSLLFLFAVGLTVGVLYVKVAYQKKVMYLPLLAMFYAQSAYSFVSSILSYNTMILALIMFTVYMGLAQKYTRSSEITTKTKKRKFKKYKFTW